MTVVKDATESVSKLSGKKKKSKLIVRDHGQEEGEVFENSESYQDLGNRFSALSFNWKFFMEYHKQSWSVNDLADYGLVKRVENDCQRVIGG